MDAHERGQAHRETRGEKSHRQTDRQACPGEQAVCTAARVRMHALASIVHELTCMHKCESSARTRVCWRVCARDMHGSGALGFGAGQCECRAARSQSTPASAPGRRRSTSRWRTRTWTRFRTRTALPGKTRTRMKMTSLPPSARPPPASGHLPPTSETPAPFSRYVTVGFTV